MPRWSSGRTADFLFADRGSILLRGTYQKVGRVEKQSVKRLLLFSSTFDGLEFNHQTKRPCGGTGYTRHSKRRAERHESSTLSTATVLRVKNPFSIVQTSWDSIGFHKADLFGSIPKSATGERGALPSRLPDFNIADGPVPTRAS